MTPRSLFSVILKILGILFLKDFLFYASQFVLTASFSFKDDFELMTLLLALLASIFYFTIIYLLVFKSNFIINRLSLDKGYPEELFNINIHRSVILSITLNVLGCLILVEWLPVLIEQLLTYIQLRKQHNPYSNFNFIDAIRVFIGLLLIIYQRTIVNFIELKRKRNHTASD